MVQQYTYLHAYVHCIKQAHHIATWINTTVTAADSKLQAILVN